MRSFFPLPVMGPIAARDGWADLLHEGRGWRLTAAPPNEYA
jgi:hypothetical protein